VSEAGAGHDLLDGDVFKAVAIEELARAINNGFFDLCAVSNGISIGFLLAAVKYALKSALVTSKRLS